MISHRKFVVYSFLTYTQNDQQWGTKCDLDLCQGQGHSANAFKSQYLTNIWS